MKNTKKIISLMLAASMAISAAGCSFGAKKEVKAATDDFMEVLLDMDMEEMEEVMKDPDDLIDDYSAEGFTRDVMLMILSNAEYTQDKVTVKKDKATVTVELSLPDYEALEDENFTDTDEIEDFIEDLDKTTYELELELVNKKDSWLVDNSDDVIDFYDEISECCSDLLSVGQFTYDDVYDALNRIDHDLAEEFEENIDTDYRGISHTVFYYHGAVLCLYEYNDADDAIDQYEDIYDKFEDAAEDGDLDWYYTDVFILVEGDIDGDYGYFAVFSYGSNLLIVGTEEEEHKDDVDEILDELGFPKPSSFI